VLIRSIRVIRVPIESQFEPVPSLPLRSPPPLPASSGLSPSTRPSRTRRRRRKNLPPLLRGLPPARRSRCSGWGGQFPRRPDAVGEAGRRTPEDYFRRQRAERDAGLRCHRDGGATQSGARLYPGGVWREIARRRSADIQQKTRRGEAPGRDCLGSVFLAARTSAAAAAAGRLFLVARAVVRREL
jgi:hypothetical protein